MPRSWMAPYSREAPRCTQCACSTPTLPLPSRNATSSSVMIFKKRGVSVNSMDMQIGCQKRRMYSPVGVPGPVSVNSGSWPTVLFV
ncbi:hypothetical protein D9M68_968740 [compost metagenome]